MTDNEGEVILTGNPPVYRSMTPNQAAQYEFERYSLMPNLFACMRRFSTNLPAFQRVGLRNERRERRRRQRINALHRYLYLWNTPMNNYDYPFITRNNPLQNPNYPNEPFQPTEMVRRNRSKVYIRKGNDCDSTGEHSESSDEDDYDEF
jgi:hypothetical protein